MATPENTFIASVHRHLPVELYHMKNHNQYNGGIADVWYSGDKADLWVEYKFVALPKRGDTLVTVALSELQKNWLRCRHHEGRNVGVVVGCKAGGVWFGGVSWDRDYCASEFFALTRTRNEIATMLTKYCCR